MNKDIAFELAIIVPMYNSSEYVYDCIHSIVSCSGFSSSILIVIVDDGSTDGSSNTIQSLLRDNIVLLRKDNGGLSSARNYGLRYAFGCSKYFSFVDSDDTITKDYIFEFYNSTRTEPDLVEFNLNKITKSGSSFKKETITASANSNGTSSNFGIKDLISRNSWYAVSRFYHRSIINENLFCEGRRYEDIILLPSLYLKAKVIYSSSLNLYNYFIRSEGITQNVRKSDILDIIYANDFFHSKVGNDNLSEFFKSKLKKQIIIMLGSLNYLDIKNIEEEARSFLGASKLEFIGYCAYARFRRAFSLLIKYIKK
ncbi:TPA: glycosyltransferase family 2 protein [Vibrio vulnificus]|nr:glycosyltransferase family 2 protein [Vibrio vulnificus]